MEFQLPIFRYTRDSRLKATAENVVASLKLHSLVLGVSILIDGVEPCHLVEAKWYGSTNFIAMENPDDNDRTFLCALKTKEWIIMDTITLGKWTGKRNLHI